MDAYYGTPVKSSARIYYGIPVKSSAQIYYGTPVDPGWQGNETSEWTLVGTYTANSKDCSPDITLTPGSYKGYSDHLTISDYTEIKIIAVSGAFNEATPPLAGYWHSYVEFVTAIDAERLATRLRYQTQSEAEDQFVGRSVTMTLGDDGLLYWGIYDPGYTGNNNGMETFRIFAR